MSLSRSSVVVSGLLLLALSAAAQEPTPPTRAAAAPKVSRLVYAIRGGSAKELANALSFAFKTEDAFQVYPDEGSNSLVLSGPEAVLREATEVLQQIDRPARTVHVEVLLLELAAGDAPGGADKDTDWSSLSGPVRDVLGKVHDLQRRGVLAGVKRVQLAALTGRPTQVKVIESKPFVTGVTGTARGTTARSVSYRDAGTSVEVRPEIDADGVAALDLRVDDSRMRTPESNPTLATDEKGASIPAAEFINATLEARVRVRLGQAVLAQGLRSSSKAGDSQLLLVVAADEAAPARDHR